jgi:hypothetical protein
MKGITPLQGEIIAKEYKYTGNFLKSSSPEPEWPNSIKLNTHYPWVKGIQVSSNKGPGPFQRGDNHKNVKMGWGHFKIFFSRTTGPILTRGNSSLCKGNSSLFK